MKVKGRSVFTVLSFALLCTLVSPGSILFAEPQHQMHVPHHFKDIERWVKLFEDPERRTWQKPEEVVAALGLRHGDVVADIGAGTGYFTRIFAREVGPGGTALGLDTEPEMVAYMEQDAGKLSLTNYIPCLVEPDDPGLEPQSVDIVFISNTLHHIENRVAYMKELATRLKKDGRVVIVDFHKHPLPVGPPPVMKLAEQEVVGEFRQAGYRLLRSHDFLPHQYFLEFQPE